MKKNLLIIAVTAFTLLCTSCASNKSETDTSASSKAPETVTDAEQASQEWSEPYFDEDSLKPIRIMTLDREGIRAVIDSCENFTAAADFIINIPESAPVLSFISYGPHQEEVRDMAADLETFKSYLAYFYPGREIHDDCLYYDGPTSDVDTPNLVKDDYDILMTCNNRITLIYDEEKYSGEKNPVYAQFSSDIGYGYGFMERGMLFREAYANKTEQDDVFGIYFSLFRPDDSYYFQSVGIYPADSDDSFKLYDREMTVKDAVGFYENYLDSIPSPFEKNMRTKVACVIVFKVSEDTYCYEFITTPEYKGIMHDYRKEQVISSDIIGFGYNLHCMCGAMYKSDEVDIVQGLYQRQLMREVKVHESVIPVDEAIRIISSKMTKSINFEVRGVEMLYSRKYILDEEGHVNIDTYESAVTPSWKVTLYNPNDGLTYTCYVDAWDGGNYRYNRYRG